LERISINTNNHTSDIYVGESRTNILNYMPDKKAVIITDDNVRKIYGDEFPSFPVFSITPGEGSKNLKTIEMLAGRLLETGLDRSGFILAVGGGVVCDIAGFLASVYMRGLPFGFISSSLLSQVDASVGGKNGVNIGLIKNAIGNFNQPEFVICDPSMLNSLPEDEYLSGLAELIKMGVIMDSNLLDDIENNREAILRRDTLILESLVSRSVRLKASVVTEDERESGLRMILNFGHTFGHVIETAGDQKHGFAVASGMVIAAGISEQEGLLSVKELTQLVELLKSFDLLKKHHIPAARFSEIIAKDKKKRGDEISFVLLEGTGKAVVRNLSVDNLMKDYNMIYHLL